MEIDYDAQNVVNNCAYDKYNYLNAKYDPTLLVNVPYVDNCTDLETLYNQTQNNRSDVGYGYMLRPDGNSANDVPVDSIGMDRIEPFMGIPGTFRSQLSIICCCIIIFMIIIGKIMGMGRRRRRRL